MLDNFKDAQKSVGFCVGNRPKGDFYSTPVIAVEKLLTVETFPGTTLEPCCGNGSISNALVSTGHEVVSSDLYDWGYGETGVDFLKTGYCVDNVITNPPFKLASEFLAHSLECTRQRKGKVAFLNRIQWLEGARRRNLFQTSPFARLWVFSKRIPRMNRFDYNGKQGTTLLCFAWFIFDWKHEGDTVIGWI